METQANTQTLPIGHPLQDYRITAVLGQGGFGITYKATDETLRRDVAIKEYLPQQFAYRDASGQVRARSAEDEEMFQWGLTRFVDEARALAMFRHPNIVSVIRFFEQHGTAYLIMEFEEGMDLQQWLVGRGIPDEQRVTQGILVPILEGLARVHAKGLLHRDIKPANIFIRRDGSPVLIDFGASRPHGGDATTTMTTIISAGYSPFEQYGTGDRQGPWSDLYALAGTIYRVIAGAPPTDAIARQQGAPMTPAVEAGAGKFSKPLLKALDRALSLKIDERPQSAQEFLALLGVTAKPPLADPDATVVRRPVAGAAPKPKRRRGLIAAVSALVLALAGVGAAYQLGGWADDAPPEMATSDPAPTRAPLDETDRAADVAATAVEPEPETTEPALTDELAGREPAMQEPASETPPENPPEDPLSEALLLAGLDLPSSISVYRDNQLAGTLLAYTRIKTRFDECRASGCGELAMLITQLRETMETQTWRRGDANGTLTIENPRRLDSDTCPFMLDVREQLTTASGTREQVRTYCTSNGFDRVVQEAGELT